MLQWIRPWRPRQRAQGVADYRGVDVPNPTNRAKLVGQERHRHAEFRALRTSGEWFRLESPLIEHIAKLRAQQ